MLKNNRLFTIFISMFIISQVVFFSVVVTQHNAQNKAIEEVNTIGGNITLDGNKKTRVKVIEVIHNSKKGFYVETGDIVYLLEDNSYITVHKDNTCILYSAGDMEEYNYNSIEVMLQNIHFVPYFEII